MERRTTLVWLLAIIAGAFMVVPALASAQEQGSGASDSVLTDEVTADDEATTEDPAAETPSADPPAEPVEPAEPAVPAAEPVAEAPDAGGFDGSADTSKAPAEPAASSDSASAVPAAAPEPEPAEVAAVEATATDSPGNDGDAGGTTAGRAVARGGGELEATKASSESKPGCLARGGANEIHNTFPDDGSCSQSIGPNDIPEALVGDGVSDLSLVLNGVTVTFDLWLTDSDGSAGVDTVNFTILTGGPASGAFYVKGGPPHNQCLFSNLANGAGGSCPTAVNPNNGTLFGFSHLDVCLGENPPPPPPPDDTPPVQDTPPRDDVNPPDDEVLTEEEREQQQQQQEELEEAVPPTAIPTAVTPAPDEALPFTGLDTGWLVLLSIALLGSGVLLRRQVS